MFQEWLEATAARHQDLLARTNSSKFQGREKPKTNTFAANTDSAGKPKKFDCPMRDGQHALWSCEKFRSFKVVFEVQVRSFKVVFKFEFSRS